jgi:dienelactone hydrolase
MSKFWPSIIGLISVMFSASTALAAGGKYIELKPRPDVVLPIYVIQPDKPKAAVVLLPGGKGVIRLGPDGPEKGGNFLVRTRDLFAQQELLVAVVDAPIEDEVQEGLKGERTTREHATDIVAVATYLQKQAGVPVWVVGTSRGTIGATNLAARMPEAIHGIVLTSTVSKSSKTGLPSVMDTDLANIKVPVLLVHHEKDGCYVSPYSGMEKVRKKLINTSKVDAMSFSGGKEKLKKPCKAKTYHGYLKIEAKVVKAISDWIKLH